MDTYFARKLEPAPLDANVPDVKFLRTHVHEHMLRCMYLCDGPRQAAIRRAREAATTPISHLGAAAREQLSLA